MARAMARDKDSDGGDSKIIEARINWRTKTVRRPNVGPATPEGCIPYMMPYALPAVSGIEREYMRTLMERAGIVPDTVKEWEAFLQVTNFEENFYPIGNVRVTVPAGTLFLGINYNHREGNTIEGVSLQKVKDACQSMLDDPHMQEIAKALVRDRHIFRVWLDVNDRLYHSLAGKKMPEKYETPFDKMAKKTPKRRVKALKYHVQLTPFDLVVKK